MTARQSLFGAAEQQQVSSHLHREAARIMWKEQASAPCWLFRVTGADTASAKTYSLSQSLPLSLFLSSSMSLSPTLALSLSNSPFCSLSRSLSLSLSLALPFSPLLSLCVFHTVFFSLSRPLSVSLSPTPALSSHTISIRLPSCHKLTPGRIC